MALKVKIQPGGECQGQIWPFMLDVITFSKVPWPRSLLSHHCYLIIATNLSEPCPGSLSWAGHNIFLHVSSNRFLSACLAFPNLAPSCPSRPQQADKALQIPSLACQCAAQTMSVVSQEIQMLMFKLPGQVNKGPICLSGLLLLYLPTTALPTPAF